MPEPTPPVQSPTGTARRVLMLTTRAVLHDQRVVREAEALAAAGHHVRLLEWARHSPDAAAEATVGPLAVRRVQDPVARRLLRLDVLRNPVWWRAAVRHGMRWHQEHPLDVVHAHDLDTLVAGVRLKRRLGVPLVFDAHEIFHEMLEGNQPRPVVTAARRLESRLLRHVDLLVVSHPGSAAHYQRLVSVPIVTLWNAFGARPTGYVAPTLDRFTLTYIGVLSKDRLFPHVIDAVGRLDDVSFVVAGKREGVWRQVEEAAGRHPHVAFLGPVPFDEVLPRTRAGHAVLCMLDPRNPQYQKAPATKLFDAMACGRPIVATRGTYMGDFVTREDVGIACAYDPPAVAEAVANLRDDPASVRRMGENGLRLAKAEYNWDEQTARLQAAYAALPEARR